MSIINSSANFYTKKVVKNRDSYFKKSITGHSNDNTTKTLVKLAVDNLKNDNSRLLDIGTGNGYVISEIAKKNKIFGTFYFGVDLSDEMIVEARKKCKTLSNITILKADNFHLPFEDNYFDVVTNKVVTNFSLSEVHRVLKIGGLFVFKEYGLYKGFGGIIEKFKNRVKTKDPLDYLKEIRELQFCHCSYDQHFYIKKYKIIELKQIFLMAPIIRDFTENDMRLIKLGTSGGRMSVISDPFIITAMKGILKNRKEF